MNVGCWRVLYEMVDFELAFGQTRIAVTASIRGQDVRYDTKFSASVLFCLQGLVCLEIPWVSNNLQYITLHLIVMDPIMNRASHDSEDAISWHSRHPCRRRARALIHSE